MVTDHRVDDLDPSGNFSTSAPGRQQAGYQNRGDWRTTRNHASKNEDNRYDQENRGG